MEDSWSPPESIDALNTVRENHVNIWGPKLFSLLSTNIWNIMDYPVENFKNLLDLYAQSVLDQLGCGGYLLLRAAALKNMIYQRSNDTTWYQTELWR